MLQNRTAENLKIQYLIITPIFIGFSGQNLFTGLDHTLMFLKRDAETRPNSKLIVINGNEINSPIANFFKYNSVDESKHLTTWLRNFRQLDLLFGFRSLSCACNQQCSFVNYTVFLQLIFHIAQQFFNFKFKLNT